MIISEHIHKRNNKSLSFYHFVCPIKYRRNVLDESISATFKQICHGIEERYDIYFLEIGLYGNQVHFLIESVPLNAPKDIIGTVNSITAKEIFGLHPEVKKIALGAANFGQVDIMSILYGNMLMSGLQRNTSKTKESPNMKGYIRIN